MTASEQRFHAWIKKTFPEAYIRKLPDYKQVGMAGCHGLPDYLVINKGVYYWFEVKRCVGNFISLKDFTESQKTEFPWLIKAGAKINVFIFDKYLKESFLIDYSVIREGVPVEFRNFPKACLSAFENADKATSPGQ
jgi:penicillin-binding protein-related factor A (putative recombinase)